MALGSSAALTLFDASGQPVTLFHAPDSSGVMRVTNADNPPFMDDFGGTVLSPTNWNYISGGLGANPTLNGQTLTQAAIGSGQNTGMTYSVGSSALTVNMGTNAGDEIWFLSQRTFSAAENITVICSRSQGSTANSIFVGLVEVDKTTGIPLANPNLANDFTNRGGCEFSTAVSNTSLIAQALGDSSSSPASITTTGFTTLVTTAEYEIEIASEDIQISQTTVDSAAPRNASVARVSSQCPNDNKVYKLLLRFRNTATATNTNFVIQRILVECKNTLRMVIDSANGDSTGQKGLAVNIVASSTATQYIGGISLNPPSYVYGTTDVRHKLIAAATTNATSVKTTPGRLLGGIVTNKNAATDYYFKLYSKATAPTVGTDVPILTIPLLYRQSVYISDIVSLYGSYILLGIAYAITGGSADTDTTAVTTAGDVVVDLTYI